MSSLTEGPKKDLPENNTAKSDPFATLQHFPDHIIRSAKVLAYGLTIRTADMWERVALIWEMKLCLGEREAVAITALRSLPREVAASIAADFLDCLRGPVPFLDEHFMREARFLVSAWPRLWRKAVLAAIWETLGERDRAAFLERVVGRTAA